MRVGLFVTCLVDPMRPRIGFAALELLQQAGCEAVVPETQTCCGQPGYNSGDRKPAVALARKIAREFADCEYVVVPSGSCAGMIRAHYPDLIDDVPEAERDGLRALVARTWELTDFLANVVRFTPKSKTSITTITYHDSCSGLRELGVKQQPRALLAQVDGAQLREMNECEQCCGFGGAFALKYGEISAHIAERKCENITGAGYGLGHQVVSGNILWYKQSEIYQGSEKQFTINPFSKILDIPWPIENAIVSERDALSQKIF